MDGAAFIQKLAAEAKAFDLIFADSWPGKYSQLDETLSLLKPGGLYVIDDMLPQSNWPTGHAEKAAQLTSTLEQNADLQITKLNWSTGLIIAAKVPGHA